MAAHPACPGNRVRREGRDIHLIDLMTRGNDDAEEATCGGVAEHLARPHDELLRPAARFEADRPGRHPNAVEGPSKIATAEPADAHAPGDRLGCRERPRRELIGQWCVRPHPLSVTACRTARRPHAESEETPLRRASCGQPMPAIVERDVAGTAP